MIIRRSSIAVALLCAVIWFSASAANNLGDFAPSAVVYGKFSTYRPSTGAAFTLAGTPALSVYKDNSATQSTTGVTLTADFDSVTGLNHFAIDTSADGTFYSAGSNFDIVITTGTVDSVSVVGSVVGTFTIDKTMALKPTTAGRKLDVSSGGEAGIDWANVGSPTTTVNLSGTSISTSQAVASVSGNVGGNVTGSVGSVATGGLTNASFACTGGSFLILGVVDCGTAQSASSTGVVLRSAAALGDDTANGMTLLVNGSTQGYAQARAATDYVGSTDTATVDTWSVTPSGTITYYLFGTSPISGSGGGLDAAGVRAAVGLASPNLDTQLGTIDDFLDTEIGAIKTKTDFLPSATAGAAGGVFIAGTNAATTITTALTTTFTGNLTGSAGSVTGAVGSVSGNVGGNVTGSVGSVATGGITASSFANNSLTAAAAAADLATELQSGLATAGALSTASGNINDIEAIANKLDSAMELDGSVYRFTVNALEQAPVGGGGGATDWTSDERTAIKAILGIPGSGTTPADPATGILDTIRDYVDTEMSTVLSRIGTPVGASLSADIAGVESGISWNSAWDAEIESEVTDAINALAITEPTGKPNWGDPITKWIAWIGAFNRNKVTQTSTTKSLRNDADNANIATCTVGDDGTTFTVAECTP